LPTGAGVQAVRDNLYFPDAPIGHPLLVLGLYAGIGCVVVLVTNLLANRANRTAEFGRDRPDGGPAQPEADTVAAGSHR
jgi:hypothetical protein